MYVCIINSLKTTHPCSFIFSFLLRINFYIEFFIAPFIFITALTGIFFLCTDVLDRK
ncbi:hypothetical protein NVIRPANT_00779 [Pantoea sp. Nvir]|nr:hypothetical protein NVIRPANT_00779 [Pantoea sp. Nvir]